MAVMRPPMVAGPMDRHWNLFTHPAGMTSSAGVTVLGSAFGSLRALSLAWRSASCFSRVAISFSRSGSLAGWSSPRPAPAAKTVRPTARSAEAATRRRRKRGVMVINREGRTGCAGSDCERRPEGPRRLPILSRAGWGPPAVWGLNVRTGGGLEGLYRPRPARPSRATARAYHHVRRTGPESTPPTMLWAQFQPKNQVEQNAFWAGVI